MFLSGFQLTAQDEGKAPFEVQKLANLQTTKTAESGELQFNVAHRFGDIQGGIKTFFGLDQANTSIQLLYGLTDFLQVSVSRESIRRTYSGDAKLALLKQSNGKPFDLAAYSSIHANTELDREVYPKMLFYDRLSYASQLLVARKFGDHISLELAPTFVRQNLVLEPFQQHNQVALGVGGKVYLTEKMSINLEYIYNMNRAEESIYYDPIAIGLDFETFGHVFQLLFTNAQSTTGPGYITNAEGNIEKGEIFFGFNISRKF